MAGWRLAIGCAALIVAGAGLMMAVLPRHERLSGSTGAIPDGITITCDSPVVDAFREAADPPGAWFAYAPNTGVLFNDSGFCVRESRTRLSWGAAAAAIGSIAAIATRPKTPSA